MVRGLDGLFLIFEWYPWLRCGFQGPSGAGLCQFPVALARGKHLFPFRTEQLSPSAPMVLDPSGPGE